jgi:hypothetical protein
LDLEGERTLSNTVIDVVSLPGRFYGGTESKRGRNDTALLGMTLEELMHQDREENKGSAKPDLNQKTEKPVSLLYQVRSSIDLLRKQIKVLLKFRDRVLKGAIPTVQNACLCSGWLDTNQVSAWTQRYYLTRMVQDTTVDYYLALCHHLMSLAATDALWQYV